jgi:hypothetical protein
MLFDDYDYHFPGEPERDTAHAIDAFIKLYGDEVKVIAKGRQLLLQKTGPGDEPSEISMAMAQPHSS